MRPVRELAGNATQLLISPDGALNLVPFAALTDERGRFLLERYSLSYLTSGRDLLRSSISRQSKSPPLIVADPLFGEPAAIASGENVGAKGSLELDDSHLFFGPLPGVGDEVQMLKELLPDATTLTKAQATKAALKRTRAPSILHVSFCQMGEVMGHGSGARGLEVRPKINNPLLRSGLALAGANLAYATDEETACSLRLKCRSLTLFSPVASEMRLKSFNSITRRVTELTRS
jgi:hypothetical protein